LSGGPSEIKILAYPARAYKNIFASNRGDSGGALLLQENGITAEIRTCLHARIDRKREWKK
jgi:hypothetical protein